VANGDAIVSPRITRRLLDVYATHLPDPSASTTGRVQAVLDQLTPREREVLRAVAAGLSNIERKALVGRGGREVVGPWAQPAVGRLHVLPLATTVITVLFGLRHNVPDDVVREAFGFSQAVRDGPTTTRKAVLGRSLAGPVLPA
jgi:hypothetical protein